MLRNNRNIRAYLIPGRLDIVEHAMHVLFTNARADFGVGVHRITDTQRAYAIDKQRHELIVQGTVHEHARAIVAHL